jgi:branched-subunit amino acid aminotransferase/4-amino-4-deoxychorismate lyase
MEHTEVVEQLLTPDVLKHADGVFISNAIRRIKWVAAIGNNTYSKNAIVAFANSMKWQ